MRIVVLVLACLLAAGCGSSRQAAEPIVYEQAGFVFPPTLGVSYANKQYRYENPSLGMGLQYKNAIKPITTSVFIYPKNIPGAVRNLQDEFDRSGEEMLSVLRNTPELKGAEHRVLDATTETLSNTTFLRKVVVVGDARTEYLYLAPYRDYFLKVRVTKLEKDHLTNTVWADATVLALAKYIESDKAQVRQSTEGAS